MKFNEQLLKNKINENLKKVKNPLDRDGKTNAIVEALNFFDNKRDWVTKINREDITSLITNSKDQEVLCESILEKVNNTPFTKALKESKKKKEVKQKLNESLIKKPLKEEKLNEGTSNFYDQKYIPLLVFMMDDEIEAHMDYDNGRPNEDDFEDYDDYFDALEKFKDEFYDKYYKGVCILTEEDVDDLKFDLDTFNSETKELAYRLDVNEDGYQEYGDNINLEDIMLVIEPGYYEGAQIKCEYEKNFDYLTEDVKKAQLERFNTFLDNMQKKYGLTKLKTAYRMSNGETGYTIVEELKHLNEGVKKTVKFAVPESEMGAIQKKIDDCGFTINSLGNKDGYDEFEVVGDADKEDCWKVVGDLVKEINTHKNVTVANENLQEADDIQTKATKMLSEKKYYIDMAWKNGKTWKTEPMTLKEIGDQVDANVTEKQFVDMMSDNIKNRKDAKNLTKAEIVKVYDYIDGQWQGKDVLWSINGKTNESLNESEYVGNAKIVTELPKINDQYGYKDHYVKKVTKLDTKDGYTTYEVVTQEKGSEDKGDTVDIAKWQVALKETLKENKLQEKNEYYAYMDKDYAELLDSNVDVYDVDKFILSESNNELKAHYTSKYAIILCANGKGCVVDYEAVGQDFDSIDSEISFGAVSNKDNEYVDDKGVKHKTISIIATHEIKTTPKEVMEKAPKETMKYRDFFTKYDYNDRCASNFKSLAGYIEENSGLQEGCHSKKKKTLKEGYIGQTLEDFFYDCVDPDTIGTVSLWGEDDEIYNGDYDGAIEEYGNNEFIEFDCGMDKVVINVDTSEEYQVTDYFVDVQDFIEFFNGDEIEVYDLNTGETLFSGDKYDLPDDVAEKIFISFDAPKFISVNIEEDGDSDDDYDESLKESNNVLRLQNGGFAYISDYNKDQFEKEYVETGKYKKSGKAQSPKGKYTLYTNSVGDTWAVLDENLKEALGKIQEVTKAIDCDGNEFHVKPIWKTDRLATLVDKDGNQTKVEIADLRQYYDLYDQDDEVISRFEEYNENLKEDVDNKTTFKLSTGNTPILDAGLYYSMLDELNPGSGSNPEKFKEFEECVMNEALPILQDLVGKTDGFEVVSVDNYYHPRYYNYETDELDFTVKYNGDNLGDVIGQYSNNPEFIDFLKNYSSSSGFISFYADNKDDFITQEPQKSVSQIIKFNVSQDDYEKANEELYYNVSDCGFYPDDEMEENLKENKLKEDRVYKDYVIEYNKPYNYYIIRTQGGSVVGYINGTKVKNRKDIETIIDNGSYEKTDDYIKNENLKEDTVKQNGKWVNKGDTGKTHGEFKTKKEADKQRKAMFAGRKPNAKWGK